MIIENIYVFAGQVIRPIGYVFILIAITLVISVIVILISSIRKLLIQKKMEKEILDEYSLICPNCGCVMDSDSNFCLKCGIELN